MIPYPAARAVARRPQAGAGCCRGLLGADGERILLWLLFVGFAISVVACCAPSSFYVCSGPLSHVAGMCERATFLYVGVQPAVTATLVVEMRNRVWCMLANPAACAVARRPQADAGYRGGLPSADSARTGPAVTASLKVYHIIVVVLLMCLQSATCCRCSAALCAKAVSLPIMRLMCLEHTASCDSLGWYQRTEALRTCCKFLCVRSRTPAASWPTLLLRTMVPRRCANPAVLCALYMKSLHVCVYLFPCTLCKA